MASRWEGVRLPRASGKSPDFPGSSPNFPGSFSVTSPEVLSLWNLTAIQRFPGSFPNFPRSSPNFPGSSGTSPEVSPLLWSQKSREGNPLQKRPTPIKRVCVSNFWGCSCKLSSLFPLKKARGTQKEFGQTVCENCFQLGLLGWVVFWGGSFSLEKTFSDLTTTIVLRILKQVQKLIKVPSQRQPKTCHCRTHTKGVMQPHATLRRVLRRFSNRKCLLRRVLRRRLVRVFRRKTRFLEGFLEGSVL